GGYLALILSFPVRLLSRVMSRGLALFLTLLSLLSLIAIAILVMVPVLISQLSSLIDSIPELARSGEALLRDILRPLQEQGMVSEDTDAVLRDLQQGLIDRASTIAERLLDDVLGAIT